MSHCRINCCVKILLLLFALNLPPASFTWRSLVLHQKRKRTIHPYPTHDWVLCHLFSVGYHFSTLNNPGHLNLWITLTSGFLHNFSYLCCSSLDLCHLCYSWARAAGGRHTEAHPVLSIALHAGMSHQLYDSLQAKNKSFHGVITTARCYCWVGTSWLEMSHFQSLYCTPNTPGILTAPIPVREPLIPSYYYRFPG